MGVMKRIATEMQCGNKSLSRFAPGEREAIRAITRSSEALLKFLAEEAAPKPTAGGVPLSSIWLGSVYTGDKPERAGWYVVVDTVSETREVVKTALISGSYWAVFRTGHSDFVNLSDFNKPAYHWFHLMDLGPDDLKFIRRELP